MVEEHAVRLACIALRLRMMRSLRAVLLVSDVFCSGMWNLETNGQRLLVKIPSAWVPSRDLQSVRIRVGHYGRDTRAMASVVRLDWLVCMTVRATLLELVLRLHQWEVILLLFW